MFGKEPSQIVPRVVQIEEIIQTFLEDMPSSQIYMITGVRGSGKTVLMTEIANRFRKEESFIVVELNPARDLLEGLAARLYNEKSLVAMFKRAKIDLSFFGIGVEISGSNPVTDIEVALGRMLEQLKQKGKKLLITIDEVVSSPDMKTFASAFQIFVRQDYPIMLLITGLYENIDTLQNDKILTFLHRAPKVYLKPLNTGRMATHYEKTFAISPDEAREMARLTRGYPFAFQVLGYYTYEKRGDFHAAIPETRLYLEEYAYDKIWSELSTTDRKIVAAMAKTGYEKVADIRRETGMESNEFSPYRDRLVKKGIVDGEERGYLRFILPFFEDYVLDHT